MLLHPFLPTPPLCHLNTKVRVKEVQCLDNFLHFLCHRFFHSEADLNDLGSSYSLSFDSFKKPAASQLWTGWQCSRALRRLLRLTLIRRSGGLNNTLQLCEGGLSPVHLCCQAPGPETRHLRSFIQAQATFSLKVCLINHPMTYQTLYILKTKSSWLPLWTRPDQTNIWHTSSRTCANEWSSPTTDCWSSEGRDSPRKAIEGSLLSISPPTQVTSNNLHLGFSHLGVQLL